jgi:adenosylcobinamide-GDP ribazoletransferase
VIAPVRGDEDRAGLAGGREVPRQGVAARVDGELRAALTMLTRLPIRGSGGDRTGAAAFGLVGGLVGLGAFVPLVLLGDQANPLAAIVAVGVLVVLSGAIHLDGLADTADALMAFGPDGAERARRDPSVGVGGVVALVFILATDVTALALIAAASPVAAGAICFLAAATSRVTPVVLVRLARAHTPDGLGGWFAARTTTGAAAIAVTTAVLAGIAATVLPGMGVGGGALAGAGLVGGFGGLAVGLGIVRIRRQLDGDVLGASVELSFALTVAAAAVFVGLVR